MVTEEQIAVFEKYQLGKMSEKDALEFEMNLSLDNDVKSDFRLYQLMIESASHYRRKKLSEYIIKNSSTKLTGNIWGNIWTKISIIIILLTGLLIWLSEKYPPESKRNTPTQIEEKKY